MMEWWRPENFARRQPLLAKRMALVRAIRAFFDSRHFWEVETPVLQVSPVMDTHILAMKTELRGIDKQVDKTLYLHTSPEFAMKKLMVAGVRDLYQICHVFRDADHTRLHSREFTMIEWYRTGADYGAIMQDCIDLLRHAATATDTDYYRHGGAICDPFADWNTLSVTEAFAEYAGLDLTRFLPAGPDDTDCTPSFRAAIAATGQHTAADDRWDDLFHRVMGAKIEPRLGQGAPCIIYDYPVTMASLSRPKPTDPRYAERFELYACSLELANAFSELTDSHVQRARFHEEMAVKEQLYGERYPIDEDFLAALDYGLPASAGIALGIDRLAMLTVGADDLGDVLWTPRP